MKTAEQIANVIAVRNHLSMLLNGTRNVIKKTEVPVISNLIQKLDAEIVQASLGLFQDQTTKAVGMADEVDIQKKVAEAKAKMAALKAGPGGAMIKSALKVAQAPVAKDEPFQVEVKDISKPAKVKKTSAKKVKDEMEDA